MIRPPGSPRRLAYLGTPEAAVPPLRALHRAGYSIELVVSRADARRGRNQPPSPSPVKAAAQELGVRVTDRLDDVSDTTAELGVVVAYGRLIRPEVLARLPMVNLHFSLLPRWRGAAPVERAILAGDEWTGVCLMAVEEGLDTGGVYRRAETPIGPEETASELRARLVEMGTDILLAALAEGLGDPEPQRGEPTYADKIRPEELELRWERPGIELHRLVRIGGAFTYWRGRRLKVHRARLALADDFEPDAPPGTMRGPRVRTGDGALELQEVQPEGRARQDVGSWLRGLPGGEPPRLGS